ncbi:MAG: dUTP diphosphatase [Glaciecola sp.]
MDFQAIHPNFKLPSYGSEGAAAFDLFMPDGGAIPAGYDKVVAVNLGFMAAVPEGHVALILPRSGTGIKTGLSLRNTCGVIDSDYRGEWRAVLKVDNDEGLRWEAGARLLQVMVVPVVQVQIQQVGTLSETARGAGGFGSTGE